MPRALLTLEMEVAQIMKGGYDHFMKKEIHEQPDSVLQTMSGRVRFQRTSSKVLSWAGSVRLCMGWPFVVVVDRLLTNRQRRHGSWTDVRTGTAWCAPLCGLARLAAMKSGHKPLAGRLVETACGRRPASEPLEAPSHQNASSEVAAVHAVRP